MHSRYCCPECFSDRGLRKNIIPTFSNNEGTCDYCGSENVLLVEPIKLRDAFESLVGIYEPDPDGLQLVDLFKRDWELFRHPAMNKPQAKELLAEILDDGDITRQNFSLSSNYKSEGLLQWESLRDELMHRNRYFLNVTLDFDRLASLLVHLPADDMPYSWFRARIQHNGLPFKIDEMGAPPESIATHGRANPSGIPYLYVSSTPETAAAEIRPHTGETASVADFQIRNLAARDLRNPRELVSPFLLGDPSAIGQLLADIPFLEKLGEELTRPVLPRSAAIDYLPSQYLCEFIKKCGYDGVVYKSSVSDGINLALFDSSKAAVGAVRQYTVDKVSVNVTQQIY